MLRQEDIDRFYKQVELLDFKFPVAAIAKATGFSKGNVSNYLSRKMEPSENFLKAFYSKFPYNSLLEDVSILKEPTAEYKTSPRSDLQSSTIIKLQETLIKTLEHQADVLKQQLDLSLGELRHRALLNLAISETTQNLVIELLAKQRKMTWDEVALEVGKLNGEKYQKLKEEGSFAYVGK
jgi:hypothetical protein